MNSYPDLSSEKAAMTVFEHVEKLKRDYTDRFVVVDESCAELARFKGQTGRVKTVNMNGRALVEFDHYANIGWFDIDVDYLKVVDRPVPKKEEVGVPAAKKSPGKSPAKTAAAAAEKQLSPLEMARLQDSSGAKKPAAADSGKMSTADILAAARGKKAPPAESKTEGTETPSAAPSTAAAKSAAEMSLAEKLAAARGEVAPSGAERPPAAAAEQDRVATAAAAATASPEPSAEVEQAVDPPAGSRSGEVVDKSTMSVGDMIAWCRAHDGA
jgi:hypothetical protein